MLESSLSINTLALEMIIKSEPATIILASASPRRRQLLDLAGWGVIVCPVEVDELPRHDESAEALVRRLALAKVRTAAASIDTYNVILAADTVVADEDRLLGKPADTEEAEQMLIALRGKSHRVLTTIALVEQRTGREVVETCETSVPMRDYTQEETATYIASKKPLDKAGAYGIQDETFSPVALERLHGCYTNVMGLPLCHLARAMYLLGGSSPVDVPTACQAFTGFTCIVYDAILKDQA